ncbi:hypothetical protein CLI64_02580 [Nostoc sp. CENA543]|nr:hypothetical protein CLI64_02580 [Nostoc sp. CENA543]
MRDWGLGIGDWVELSYGLYTGVLADRMTNVHEHQPTKYIAIVWVHVTIDIKSMVINIYG